jgi:HK97 family phage major capsid protein
MADITRAEVSTLIEEEYSHTLLDAAEAASTVLAAFPIVNMGTKTVNLPVLATLSEADWVSDTDNTGVKPTSQVTWANKTLVAEEIAVIIPIHENTLEDATVDLVEQIAQDAGRAIAKKLDEAVLFGYAKPITWTSLDLLAAAVAAGQTFEVVDGDANLDDLWGAIAQAAAAVAVAGYAPGTLLASLALRWQMANIRDADGNRAFAGESFAGFDTFFNRNGAWDVTAADALIVDPSRVRIGVRQDITVKLLDQATLGTGESAINLAERDMVAFRFKARYAYVLGSGTTSLGVSKTPVAAVVPSDESGS